MGRCPAQIEYLRCCRPLLKNNSRKSCLCLSRSSTSFAKLPIAYRRRPTPLWCFNARRSKGTPVTISEAGRRLRAREISCLELVENTLIAIAEREELNAFLTVMGDAASARARLLDAELQRGHD